MASQYKLIFFKYEGFQEPAREMFAYAKVDYEDVGVTQQEWEDLKESSPWGQLPILEVDGIKIGQSCTIYRFLAKKFGLQGDSDIEAAACDEIADVINSDMRNEWVTLFHEKDEAKNAELFKKFDEESLPKWFDKLTAILNKNGTGYLVGNKLTYADIICAWNYEYLRKLFDFPVLSKYTELKKHVDMVYSKPGIKEWVLTFAAPQ